MVHVVKEFRGRIAPIMGSLESLESKDCCLPKLCFGRKRDRPGLAKKPPVVVVLLPFAGIMPADDGLPKISKC